jgi:hypothetical protein
VPKPRFPGFPVSLVRRAFAPRRHPQTGDLIKFSEHMTWRAMGIYRRWTVFFLLQVLTALWWAFPRWFPGGLFGWNLVWSDLAIIVEMMVGIAFLGQSMRDARVLRAEMAELKEMHRELQRLILDLHQSPRGPLPDRPGRPQADLEESGWLQPHNPRLSGEGPWIAD